MFCFEFEGTRPTVHPEAFVAPTATLIGDVTVEKGASVWYGAVLRADICTIVVREGANVQDNCVLHGAPGETVVVGRNVTVGHGCVVHCAEVGEQALVGNASTLLDGARVGPRTLVAAGSVVTPGTELPAGVVAAGIPAKATKSIEGTSSEFLVEHNAAYYRELAERHRAGAPAVDPGTSAGGARAGRRPGRSRRPGRACGRMCGMPQPSPWFSSPADAATRLAGAGYLADASTATTAYLAGALEKPLLVEGPAGAG